MLNWTSTRSAGGSRPFISILTSIALGLGGLLTVIWLWCCWCAFPANPWNDIRVAPAVALHHGISIYSTSSSGPVSTWIYGPLPLLIMWPAGLASTAIGAIQTAGAIHIGLTLFVLTITCIFWPSSPESDASSRHRQLRFGAVLLCVLLVRNPTSGYTIFTADAPGIAFGLLALLALSHGRYWIAATCAAAAVACKQTLIGVGVAQLVWLFVADSPRAAIHQLGRLFLAGLAMATIAVCPFGVAGLWHTMVELPSSFPWARIPDRLREHSIYLLIHIALPLAVMTLWRRKFFHRQSPLLLPTVAFLCTTPFSFAGFLKIGGNVNSLHSFWLWFPPTLVVMMTGHLFEAWGEKGRLVIAMTTAMMASYWLQISRLPVLPAVEAYREAAYLANRLPERIWFPLHPLVTLYSDRRFYHDLDGLCERTIAKKFLSDEHFFAHIPPERQASATLLPVGWGLADISEGRLPRNTPVRTFGRWRVDGYLE